MGYCVFLFFFVGEGVLVATRDPRGKKMETLLVGLSHVLERQSNGKSPAFISSVAAAKGKLPGEALPFAG